MGLKQTLVGFCLLLSLRGSFAEVWEFGRDTDDSTLVVHNEGRISIFEKTTRVKLTVPPCYTLSYVRIEVNNPKTPPEVTFNNNTNTVVIQNMLFTSVFKYKVFGKANKYRYCGHRNRKERTFYLNFDDVVLAPKAKPSVPEDLAEPRQQLLKSLYHIKKSHKIQKPHRQVFYGLDPYRLPPYRQTSHKPSPYQASLYQKGPYISSFYHSAPYDLASRPIQTRPDRPDQSSHQWKKPSKGFLYKSDPYKAIIYQSIPFKTPLYHFSPYPSAFYQNSLQGSPPYETSIYQPSPYQSTVYQLAPSQSVSYRRKGVRPLLRRQRLPKKTIVRRPTKTPKHTSISRSRNRKAKRPTNQPQANKNRNISAFFEINTNVQQPPLVKPPPPNEQSASYEDTTPDENADEEISSDEPTTSDEAASV